MFVPEVTRLRLCYRVIARLVLEPILHAETSLAVRENTLRDMTSCKQRMNRSHRFGNTEHSVYVGTEAGLLDVLALSFHDFHELTS